MRPRWSLAGAAACVMFFTSPLAEAQVTPYVVTHDFTGTFAPLPAGVGTSHTPVAYGTQPAWDEGAARIPIGFDFDFFGRTYTELWAFTNGFVSLAPPPSGVTLLTAPRAVPRATDPVDAYIAPMWQDLDRDRSTTPLPSPPVIRSAVNGAVGSRTLTIEYRGFKRARSPQSDVNFQIILSEGSQRVRVVYGRSFGILNATAAMEGGGGQDGFSLFEPSATCTGTCPCGPASCSSTPNFPDGLIVDAELPTSPELVGGIFGPPGARPGASFDARVVARNAGLVAASGFDYEVYLSPSDTSTAGADLLGRYRAPAGLARLSAVSSTESLSVPPGTPVSTRYLAIAVDTAGEVNEAFEANNLAFGGAFNTGPELRGRLTAPRVAGPGQPLAVQLDVENAGAPETRSFDVTFWLSTDATLDMQDTRLDTRTLSLPDGFRRAGPVTVNVPFSVPVSPPAYRLLAVLDSGAVVDEIDETNNVVVSAGLLDVVGPDVEVAIVRTSSAAVRGVPFPVEINVRNGGGGPALGVTACVFVGPDANVDLASDAPLAETAPFDLPAGAGQALRLEPTLPAGLAASDRFVVAGVDCGRAVAEADETNNLTERSGGPVTVRDPSPDYALSDVASPARVIAGERVEVAALVANRGTASGAPVLGLFASSDPAITAGDVEIGRLTLPSVLAPGDVLEVAVAGELPVSTPAGFVFFGVLADPAGAVDEVDETNNLAASGPVPVDGGTLALVGPPAPPAEIGQPYAFRFAAAGGVAERTWTIAWASGAAPAGLAFDGASGTISGTAGSAGEGEHTFQLTVRSGGETATARGRLLVVPAGLELQVLSQRLPPARRNQAYRHALQAVGGAPPYTWRVANLDRLPVGIALDASSGVISGEPALRGAYIFAVEAADRFGRVASAPLALDVIDAVAGLVIDTAAVPSGMVGMSYATRFITREEMGPVRWSIEGGAPGLELDPATGMYTGTPTAAGSFPIVLEARETTGRGRFDRSAYVMEVVERGDLVIEGDSALPEARPGVAYEAQLMATPDDGRLVWSVALGDLPPGIELARSGVLSGTPTQLGRFPFRVRVRNGAQELRSTTRVIRVVDPEETAPPPADEGGCRCAAPRDLSSWAPLLALAGALFFRRRRSS